MMPVSHFKNKPLRAPKLGSGFKLSRGFCVVPTVWRSATTGGELLLAAGLRDQGFVVESGRFGARMDVSLTNQGPATFCLDIE